jgi:hypothetical protein
LGARKKLLLIPCLLVVAGCGTERQGASTNSAESARPTQPAEVTEHRCGGSLPSASTTGIETELKFDNIDDIGAPTGTLSMRNATDDTLFVSWNRARIGAVADGIDERGAKISGPLSVPASSVSPLAIATEESKTIPVVAGLHSCNAQGADMGFVGLEPGTYRFAVLLQVGLAQDDLGGFLYSESAEAEVRSAGK